MVRPSWRETQSPFRRLASSNSFRIARAALDSRRHAVASHQSAQASALATRCSDQADRRSRTTWPVDPPEHCTCTALSPFTPPQKALHTASPSRRKSIPCSYEYRPLEGLGSPCPARTPRTSSAPAGPVAEYQSQAGSVITGEPSAGDLPPPRKGRVWPWYPPYLTPVLQDGGPSGPWEDAPAGERLRRSPPLGARPSVGRECPRRCGPLPR